MRDLYLERPRKKGEREKKRMTEKNESLNTSQKSLRAESSYIFPMMMHASFSFVNVEYQIIKKG